VNDFLQKFNDAADELAALGVPNDEAHDLLLSAREESLGHDDEAVRDVIAGGVKVAALRAFPNGDIQVNEVEGEAGSDPTCETCRHVVEVSKRRPGAAPSHV
jgi:hypothetical protein